MFGLMIILCLAVLAMILLAGVFSIVATVVTKIKEVFNDNE